jgi:arylsulfatase A-like enzyme
MGHRQLREPWLFIVLALGCSCRGASEGGSTAGTLSPPEWDDASTPMSRPIVLDLTHILDACAFGHRGVLIDFGEAAAAAELRPGSLHPSPEDSVEHEGATWLRVRSHVIAASFYWPAAATEAQDASAFVEARIRGVLARSATFAIDGRPVGAASLAKGETRIVNVHPATPVTLAAGAHELVVHFVGGPRASDEPLAEVDWAHVGVGDSTEPYAAPTHADVVVDAVVGGRSIRSLSLRAPGFARCSGWIPADTTLEASLATAGGGDAEVEARIVRDRHAPVVLGTARVAAGGAAWTPWSVPVTGLEGYGAIASIELVVKRAAKGTRVLFGAPRVVGTPSQAPKGLPTARGVVLVVLGSISANALAPWGGPHKVSELAGVASGGVTFASNRAPSSLASAVVASMLTGLSPAALELEDVEGRLGDQVTTVQEACRQGGVATAMFTADPTTGALFGFARGWDNFVAHDPLEDVPGARVFDDAAAWISAHSSAPFFVLVHARGGHPPWDAAADDLKTMPPQGYLGMIDPRRAAEALAKARKHPARFKEDDRARAWALYDHAIDEHDVALGRLLSSLRAAGRETDTMVIVTGDVAANEGAPVPFGDSDTLDEPLLATPLVVRWPIPDALAGRREESPTSAVDLARTVLDSLGLSPPAAFQGVDLRGLAQGSVVPGQRPLAATRGARFSLRWGTYVLSGIHAHESRLCDLSLDPACIADVRGTSPLALEAIRRFALGALSSRARRRELRPTLDEHTTAALVRWGRSVEHE